MAKLDYSLVPLYVIVASAVGLTAGVAYQRLSNDMEISLTRKGQMLWANKNTERFVDRKTTLDMYKEIESGKFLKE